MCVCVCVQAHEQLLGVLGKLAAAVAPAAGGCLDSGPLRDDLVATVQVLGARLGDGGEEPALRRARHQMACVMSGALRAPPASTWVPRPAPPVADTHATLQVMSCEHKQLSA